MIKNNIELSQNFKTQAIKTILAISLYLIVYFSLLAGVIVLTGYGVYIVFFGGEKFI